ncbi:protein PAM71-homolog, chloroplastic isoform X2 [Wolffia australiana]
MVGCSLQPRAISRWKSPVLGVFDRSPIFPTLPKRNPTSPVRHRCVLRVNASRDKIVAHASNINIGAGGFGESDGNDEKRTQQNGSTSSSSSNPKNMLSRISYPLSVVAVLLGCALAFALIVLPKGNPSTVVAAIAKSGFTAAFTLIFVSEIGDKTFFIAALLAMQYDRALVLLGSMGALALMTILSVIIGRIFHSVPSQFQTTLPIGEYAAIALLIYFGLTSIKNAWELPPAVDEKKKDGSELGELAEAEEIVKEKVAKKLTSPLEIISKSFSLVFFAEWGDRSMLATIALGAAQAPWGVASGAIAGHLVATSIAVMGGAFLAKYISEKLVGYTGGVLFLVFAAATFLGIF